MHRELDIANTRGKVNRLRSRVAELDRQIGTIDRLVGQVVKLAAELYEARAWEAFGLDTWAELVEAERLTLPGLKGSARVRVAMELTRCHLSLSAVAPVLGVSRATVGNLLAKGVAKGGELPDVRLSLDGKVRRSASAPPIEAIAGELAQADPGEGFFDEEGFLSDVGALGLDHGPADAAVLAELQLRELMDSIRSLGTSELVLQRLPEANPAQRRRLAAQFHTAAELMANVARKWGVVA